MRLLILLLFVITSPFLLAQTFDVDTITNNGSDSKRINFVMLSDGYTSSQLPTFITDATDISNKIFNKTPLKEYSNFFNVYAIKVASNESGADHPGTATDVTEPVHPVIDVDNYFGSTFDFFDIHRLIVPVNGAAINSVLADNYPGYDQVIILANSPYYGGSGGAFATTSLENSAPEIAIHEIGHSFSNLADEYWAGDVFAGEKSNMTAEPDPVLVKWADWVGESSIGVYAYGSSGTASNWFRPHQNCEMRYLNKQFCAVCRERFIDKIYGLTDPIDDYTPASNNLTYIGSPLNFTLDLVLPNPNTLKTEWILNGSLFASDVTSITLNGGDLALANNTLVANITDTTLLSKSYLPTSGYLFSVSWNIDNAVLPVELIDFQAVATAYYVQLDWSTATSSGIQKYEVERSEDASAFKKINEITDIKNTNELQSYSVIDLNPFEGKSYYRLKIMEQNGDFEYSPVRVVNRVEKFFFKVYPNPSQDIVNFNYYLNSTENDMTLSLFTAKGQRLKRLILDGQKGQHELKIDLSPYPAGFYYLQIKKEHYFQKIELIKR